MAEVPAKLMAPLATDVPLSVQDLTLELMIVGLMLGSLLFLFGLAMVFWSAWRRRKDRVDADHFFQLTGQIRQALWIARPDWRKLTFTSRAFSTVWRIDSLDARDDPERLFDRVHPDDRTRLQAARHEQLKEPYELVFRLVRTDGTIRWLNERTTPVRDRRGWVQRIVGTTEDITERREAEARLRLARRVFEESADGILITDTSPAIVDVNAAFSTITGFSREEALGRNPSFMSSGRHDKIFYQEMWYQLLSQGQWRGELWDKKRNGEIFPKWVSISAVKDETGQITNFVAIFSDISSIKEAEAYLIERAHFDGLTGLPNRRMFQERLEHCLARAGRRDRQTALLYIDMDDFKIVNDTLGHAGGDQVLIETARRLSNTIRAEDTVARVGGDEFIVILSEVIGATDVEQAARRALTTLCRPYFIDGMEFQLSASIGVAIGPEDSGNAETLTRQADLAMYQAKESGRSAFRFFDKELNRAADARTFLEKELRHGLNSGELFLEFQPRLDLRSGRITGLEALVRWKHPRHGVLLPDSFLTAVQETGVIAELDRHVIREACRWQHYWQETALGQEQALAPRITAVNLSSRMFRDLGLVAALCRAVGEFGIDPGLIEIDIAETALMQDFARTHQIVDQLQSLGYRVAIDDFGSGRSSLPDLIRLPVDLVKIDRQFINCPLQPPNRMLQAAIVMARALGLRVVAKGVETAAQRNFLEESTCDEIQGNIVSAAIAAEAVPSVLLASDKRISTTGPAGEDGIGEHSPA